MQIDIYYLMFPFLTFSYFSRKDSLAHSLNTLARSTAACDLLSSSS